MDRQIDFRITPDACIMGALMVLVLPLRWLAGAVSAAVIHELWHCAAIRLCGGKVYGVRIGAGGAVIETLPLTRRQEMICAAAGPIGSLSLLLVARHFPVAALCGLAQGLYNLLPLFPLDGSRILRCGLELLAPENAPKTIRFVERAALLGIAGFGIWSAVKLGMWVLGLITLPILIQRITSNEKYLAKIENRGYNRDTLN